MPRPRPQTTPTTTSSTPAAWPRPDFAQREVASWIDGATADLVRKLDWVQRNVDEARRRLEANEIPNGCGILQSAAPELEMALARYAAMRDAKPAIAILLNAAAKEAK